MSRIGSNIHKNLIKPFYDSIPKERLIFSLNIIDKIILKIYDNDVFKLREEIL